MSHLVTGSGYLNSPVRTLLIADDNRPGSYPVQISPQTAAKSGQFTKPYRDNVMPDTPVVYGQAKVTFSGIPESAETITLTNASSIASTFTFKTNNADLVAGPNAYNVNLFSLNRAVTQYDVGLSTKQVLIKRAAERFIAAVNSATGSLITASPTDKFNVVMLTQKIPGSVGNTTNSYTGGVFVVENFTGGNSGEVRYPYGISVGSASELLQRVHSTDVTGTLSVPTSGKAGLLSAYSDQHPYGVFQPYDESSSHQAFGVHTGGVKKYGTQAKLSDEFFTRGSISGSLDEPLWVKDKIEIDLTPVISTSLRLSLVPGGGRPSESPLANRSMAFYNFSKREWQSLGDGRTDFTLDSDLLTSLNSTFIGFSTATSCSFGYPSSDYLTAQDVYDESLRSNFTGNKAIGKTMGWASPIDTYGFPLHPKYHATSSQVLEASTIIDRPFLIEKIVYEFSCSSPEPTKASGSYSSDDFTYHTGGGTFFILNQRQANITDLGLYYPDFYLAEYFGNTYYPPLKLESDSRRQLYGMYNDSTFFSPIGTGGSIPQTRTRYPGSVANPLYINTIRDLVTFGRVGAVNQSYNLDILSKLEEGFPHPADFMDLAIPVADSGSISGKYTLCQDIVGPSSNPSLGTTAIVWNQKNTLYTMRNTSTRNGLNVPTGRAYKNEFIGPKILYSLLGNSIPTSKEYVYGTEGDSLPSPYLIMPGDDLVFGWQCHVSQNINSFFNSDFTIHPGAGKLILYGSYLRDDKPVHDIYKDQLNSDAIHEALPAGPWVLDRFETEPQMMYSSSMREEHVTGTMVTRRSDGTLSVTDVGDLSIGGVRAVSARVSDGTVGARWSFFRNNRLFDEEEQYYDSMQLNPIDVLLNYSGSTSYAVQSSIDPTKANIFISIPDEYFGGSLQRISTGSNRAFIGSFAYELPKYENIDRIKKINSQAVMGEKFTGITTLGVFESSFSLASISFCAGTAPITLPNGSTRSLSLFRRAGGLSKSTIGATFSFRIGPSREYDTNPVDYDLNSESSTAASEFDIDGVNFYLSRMLGCFGEGYMQIQQCIKVPPGLSPTILTGSIYRGCRYGLINPTPLFSNAVFNGTQFGQLRDMMEPRQYTRFSLNNSTLTDAAVSVQFVDRSAAPGTYTVVAGSFTNSSNISPFVTSEHPYDDALSDYGQIWDRQTPLPETLISL